MIRAWLESARAGCALMKSKESRLSKAERSNMREIMITP
jgi:hypothetical protein